MDPHAGPAGTLAVFVLLVTVGYLLTCAVWPFGNCRRCHGAGKLAAPSLFGGRRAFRLCPRCHSTGRRLRIGRRVYNHLRGLSRDAR
jgi:hypothetical protein